jgi:hypothetical protein
MKGKVPLLVGWTMERRGEKKGGDEAMGSRNESTKFEHRRTREGRGRTQEFLRSRSASQNS